MNIQFKGKLYTVVKLACGYEWKLISVNNCRESMTMNYTQMVNAGLAHVIGIKK